MVELDGGFSAIRQGILKGFHRYFETLPQLLSHGVRHAASVNYSFVTWGLQQSEPGVPDFLWGSK